jgi:hypothetical protein
VLLSEVMKIVHCIDMIDVVERVVCKDCSTSSFYIVRLGG